MPIIKSAKKKLRQDIKRTKRNKKYIHDYKKSISDVKKSKDDKRKKLVGVAYEKIDKALKKKLIHKNKASRLKSLVAKFSGKK